MSLSILLDSAIAKQQNKSQKSHDFAIRFDEPIVLDKNKNYKAALNEVVTMSYSWYNVRAVYGNNTLRWKKKSESAWKTITLPDGMFNYDDFNSFMQKKLGKKNVGSDVLFSLATTSLADVSYSFSKEPRRLSWHPVNKHAIQSIRVYVTDGRNGFLDMNDLDLAISLFLKEESQIHD